MTQRVGAAAPHPRRSRGMRPRHDNGTDAHPGAVAAGRSPGRRPPRRGQALRSVTAVDGIDLTIEPGEVVAFLGPNGAGKTSTIDMLLGLARPTAGAVQVFGRRPARRGRAGPGRRGDADRRPAQGPHRRARPSALTACLFRSPAPGRRGPGPRRHHRRSPTAWSASAPAASSSGCASPWPCCPTRGCWSSTSRPPAWTSRAGASSGPSIREDAERGRTVLFATHYLDEADAYADRIVLISHGPGRRRRHRGRGQGLAAGRTVRATLPGADPAAARGPARRRRPWRSAATPVLVHATRLRRGRPPPADQHRRPRPRDHLPQPGGRLPRPDHRRPNGRRRGSTR